MVYFDGGEKPSADAPILSWSNLNYDVKAKDGVRRILHGISGSVHAGELVAIMGSSGAGKTTLLNVLSGRVQGGRLHGDIRFMGARRDPHSFKRMLAFVEQDDMMYPSLTVEETLRASAQLRLPDAKYSRAEKEARVEEAMRQLRLSHVRDTAIGGHAARGVSGGERKRVSIGAALVTDPALLVLDEPSSGLDSSSAEMVVALTRQMAHRRNLCTLMTIHQPSAEMVALFDKLILLAQGKLVYMGPAAQAVPYFESLGYPSTNSNPANFFIDLATIDFTSSEATRKSEARVQALVDSFADFRERGGRLLPPQAADAAGSTASASIVPDANDGDGRSSKASHADGIDADITPEAADLALLEPPPLNSWYREVLVLMKRDWTMSLRNRPFVFGLLAQCLVMMLFVSFVFFQLKRNQQSVQNRIGTLFTLVLLGTFPVVMPVMTIVMSGRGVLLRERAAGTYRMTAYFAARVLSFFPIILGPYTVLLIGVYFISHLQYDAGKFFIALGTFYSLLFSSIGFAFAMSFIVPRMEVAFTIAPVSLATLMLFAGNLSNSRAITPVLRWIKYVCIFFYAYSSFMQNELNGLEFSCAPGETGCYATGEDVVKAYGLDQLPIYVCVIVNLALGAGFYAIGYALLRWVAKPRFLWL
ncbi:hypothetical protein H4R18_003774 [Coemansia javaensis]|uniref:ABC transporter domain-containing protein n=1 Tax=Coemansia javaensis TaxID=2761396 RepID=A0A9W8LHV7_9FUNG|nr:hypothetical protein H4R18_003774 [Coemansia javaensis]